MDTTPAQRVVVAPPLDTCLEGRVILVTGASGALGQATALAAARAGACVVLLGRKVRPLERTYDAVAAAACVEPAIYPLDLEGATCEDYTAMAESIDAQCGGLDGIVHCAARFDGLTPLEHIEPDRFLRVLHANLSAPWLLTQACLSLLRARDDASVVFVLEDRDVTGAAYRGAYGLAKSALASLVSMLHAETARSSLRVHGIRPPPMATRLRARAWFAEDAARLPTPDASAQAIVHLLSGAGSDWRGRILEPEDQSALDSR